MDTTDFKRASHAIWDAMAPGWDDRHTYFASGPRPSARLFEDAGFPDPRIEEIEFVFPFADADDYWDYLTLVAGAIAMVLQRLDEDEQARVRDQIAARLGPFAAAGGIELPAVALVVSAS